MDNYLVAVCELDSAGMITGTHHVSSHAAESPEAAKAAAINETQCDWCLGDDEPLHVLFVISAPVGIEISVIEYDDAAEGTHLSLFG